MGRFYGTVIGPRDVLFYRGLDVTRGSAAVRDLELDVAMGHRPSFRLHTDMSNASTYD